MAARRLLFILSTLFAGTNFETRRRDLSTHESNTRMPTMSTSPSYSSSVPRRQSLRRTLQKPRGAIGTPSSGGQDSAVIDFDTATEVGDDSTIVEAANATPRDRRSSDARSIRSIALPIAKRTSDTRSNSFATTAIMRPEDTIPVAHFSGTSESGAASFNEWRPGSSGSTASMSLQRVLSRSESNDQSGTSMDSQSSGRWFWGSRRGSSTETSETPISSGDALGIYGLTSDPRDLRSANKLLQMVEDAAVIPGNHKTLRPTDESKSVGTTGAIPLDSSIYSLPLREASQTPDLEIPFPLELSVNEGDGVIDVKIPPLDSQNSSFGSIIGSPNGARPLPSSMKTRARAESPRTARPFSTTKHESQPDCFVGGWLRKFHPDLTLQAVQPYDSLKEKIKQAMRTEPTPTPLLDQASGKHNEKWRDVATSLIADTTSLTITQLTLRRRNAASPHHQADALFGVPTRDQEDEEFHEKVLTEVDLSLLEAIDRVISHSAESSRSASQSTSRLPSPRRSTATWSAS